MMRGHLVHDYLTRSSQLVPDQVAVTDGSVSLTFSELAVETDRLAHLLRSLGVSRGDRVAYFLKRSPACITSTAGILKTGAAYIPLDQKTPDERWQKIIVDAGPSVIICDATTLKKTLDQISSLRNPPPVISVDPPKDGETYEGRVFFLEEADADPEAPTVSEGDLDDVAYVLYTSGSTGAPKGVMVTHGNIRDYIDWAVSYFDITAQDRILCTAPFYFDMSTFDIFCSLATGATLSLATGSKLLFPETLARFVEQEECTIWKGVSSLLMYMCRAGVIKPGRMPSLHTVIFAGEPLDAQYLSQWMTTYPDITFYNGYGPTEATGVSLCYRVERAPEPGERIPIGTPCKNAQIVVLDEDGLPIEAGEIGELCISGPGISQGYLNDPAKTEAAFTPPPPGCDIGEIIYHTGDLVRQNPAGDYVFISRKDHQVKWMGYRIELAEIELNLLAHTLVKDAVVLLTGIENDSLTELVAFFEATEEIAPATLTAFMTKRVPPYMIPKRFIQMDSLPRNDRGKIDRSGVLDYYAGSN
jgi:amino acid adenylation domain-containing protein